MLKDNYNSELQLLYAVLIDKLLKFPFCVTNILAHALIILLQHLHLKKTAKTDQYKDFVIASLFPGFASPSILMANLLFLQSSKCSCRLHPLFISAGGSQGRMNQARALGGMSAGWSNWGRPWAKTWLYVLHRLRLPRVKIVGERRVWILERSPCSVTLEPTATDSLRVSTAKSMRETWKTLKRKINTSWDLKKENNLIHY